MSERAWVKDAACATYPKNVFYPSTMGCKAAIAAKQICQGCPTPCRVECLVEALTTREWDGIWGGFTVKERRTIMRKVRKEGADVRRVAESMVSLAKAS